MVQEKLNYGKNIILVPSHDHAYRIVTLSIKEVVKNPDTGEYCEYVGQELEPREYLTNCWVAD